MRKPRAAGDAWSAISRQRSTIQEPLADPGVCVDPAVAQERPSAAHLLDPREVDLADEDRLAVRRGLGHDDAERVGEERRAPELAPPSAGRSWPTRLTAAT